MNHEDLCLAVVNSVGPISAVHVYVYISTMNAQLSQEDVTKALTALAISDRPAGSEGSYVTWEKGMVSINGTGMHYLENNERLTSELEEWEKRAEVIERMKDRIRERDGELKEKAMC